jgi:hypothetical protein
VFLRVINKIKIFGAAFAVVAALGQADAAEADAAGIAFFEKNIRPVLANNCYQCHSAEARNLKGELFLDSKQGMLNGGESGPVIVPGKPAESREPRAESREPRAESREPRADCCRRSGVTAN